MDTCEIEFTRQSEAFIVFECQVDVDYTYPLASLQQGMKALGVAKVVARIVVCLVPEISPHNPPYPGDFYSCERRWTDVHSTPGRELVRLQHIR